MENEVRKIDISAKLMQMGQALMVEGTELNDYAVSQSGQVLIALSSMLLTDEDMFLFSQFCLMFTAKKMVDESRNYNDIEGLRSVMRKRGLLDGKKPRKPRGPNKKK